MESTTPTTRQRRAFPTLHSKDPATGEYVIYGPAGWKLGRVTRSGARWQAAGPDGTPLSDTDRTLADAEFRLARVAEQAR